MPARNPRQLVKEAHQIARDHDLSLIEKTTATGTDFVVYRTTPAGDRLRLGKRSSATGIRTFIARLAGFH